MLLDYVFLDIVTPAKTMFSESFFVTPRVFLSKCVDRLQGSVVGDVLFAGTVDFSAHFVEQDLSQPYAAESKHAHGYGDALEVRSTARAVAHSRARQKTTPSAPELPERVSRSLARFLVYLDGLLMRSADSSSCRDDSLLDALERLCASAERMTGVHVKLPSSVRTFAKRNDVTRRHMIKASMRRDSDDGSSASESTDDAMYDDDDTDTDEDDKLRELGRQFYEEQLRYRTERRRRREQSERDHLRVADTHPDMFFIETPITSPLASRRDLPAPVDPSLSPLTLPMAPTLQQQARIPLISLDM